MPRTSNHAALCLLKGGNQSFAKFYFYIHILSQCSPDVSKNSAARRQSSRPSLDIQGFAVFDEICTPYSCAIASEDTCRESEAGTKRHDRQAHNGKSKLRRSELVSILYPYIVECLKSCWLHAELVSTKPKTHRKRRKRQSRLPPRAKTPPMSQREKISVAMFDEYFHPWSLAPSTRLPHLGCVAPVEMVGRTVVPVALREKLLRQRHMNACRRSIA